MDARVALYQRTTTRSSQPLMTSKLRFLHDGTGMVYVNTPFTLLSSPAFARRST